MVASFWLAARKFGGQQGPPSLFSKAGDEFLCA